MSMMRRGPLDRYPAEWVLRQASSQQITGSIEFHTDEPVTFHLHGGRVYAAAPGVGEDARDLPAADEPEARREAVRLLATVLDAHDGWYYLDPLGHASGRGAWAWDTASLLMETRSRAHEDRTLAAWRERTVALRPAPHTEVVLSADAWQVVVALAAAATTSQLADRLGWNPGRMLTALDDLDHAAVVDPSATLSAPAAPTTRSPAIDPATTRPAIGPITAFPPNQAPQPVRHAGPLAPPPPISAEALAPAPDATEASHRGPLRRRRAGRDGGAR